MPEGDTIYRTASRLRDKLVGRVLRAVRQSDRAPDLSSLAEQRVEQVESRGKHLLLRLASGSTLHTHLGMTGAWHVYGLGQTWAKPERLAWVVLETDDAVAVCFRPKVIELLTPTRLRRHAVLHRLGPDILDEAFCVEAAVARFRQHRSRAIGDALLDQTIVCGIGNVYKSEALFLSQLDPSIAVAAVTDEQLAELIGIARKWMRRNLDGRRRQTRFATDGTRCWVYDRAGQPCLKCGTLIRMQRQGDLARSTYWCPECQQQK